MEEAMTRPPYVRCENCCFYAAETMECARRMHRQDRTDAGWGALIAVQKDWWCGDFRAEWPTVHEPDTCDCGKPMTWGVCSGQCDNDE